jgi:hypothetical protein
MQEQSRFCHAAAPPVHIVRISYETRHTHLKRVIHEGLDLRAVNTKRFNEDVAPVCAESSNMSGAAAAAGADNNMLLTTSQCAQTTTALPCPLPLPCHCLAVAMPLPCHCHAIDIDNAMPLPCHCQGHGLAQVWAHGCRRPAPPRHSLPDLCTRCPTLARSPRSPSRRTRTRRPRRAKRRRPRNTNP